MLDLEALARHYRGLSDDQLERLTLDELAQLDSKALPILRAELERRARPELATAVRVQIEGVQPSEFESLVAWFRNSACPTCDVAGQPLNACRVETLVFSELAVGCPNCLQRAIDAAAKKNTLGCLLGPFGWVIGPRAQVKNSAAHLEALRPVPTESFLKFVRDHQAPLAVAMRQQHSSRPRAAMPIRYARHPHATMVGTLLFPPGGSTAPVTLSEVGTFVWAQFTRPQTEADLVSAITRAFAVNEVTAREDLWSFLGELSAKDLVVDVDDPSVAGMSVNHQSRSVALLAAAFDRQEVGDWQGALGLCIEARPEADWPSIVELDILICKHHLGVGVDLAGQALALTPGLPPLARVVCWGLAMVSAFKADELRTVKTVARTLASDILHPWDLPTVPQFVHFGDQRLIVTETASIDPILEIIDAVRSRGENTADELVALDTLARRYEQRRAA